MDTKRTYHPPKLANRFLRWYCNPEKLEEIEGDAYELFYLNLEDKGPAYARWHFIWHVLTFFKWSNIRRNKPTYQTYTQTAMIRNYFKLGWRNLRKQKLTTFISVFGLSMAVASSLVAYLFIEQIWFKGTNQENKDELYQLVYSVEEDEGPVTYGMIGDPVTETLKSRNLPIKNITRVSNGSKVLIYNNESYSPRIQFVDPSYMQMFSYGLESGYLGSLEDEGEVILTSKFAELLFQDTPAIGQELSLILDGEEKFFRVGAVLDLLKDIEIFHFEVLVNFNAFHQTGKEADLMGEWNNEFWTFVQMEEDAMLPLQTELEGIRQDQNSINPDRAYQDIQVIPFNDLVSKANLIERDVIGFMGQGPIILLSVIALFVLVLAVANYVNISILMASRRLKEIGVIKIIGGRRGQLVMQFLSENFLICLGAIAAGCLLAGVFFLPGFNDIAYKNLQLDLLGNWMIWAFLAGLLVVLTLVSGIYPALYISSFKPLNILRGGQKLGSRSWITSVLLVFQFVLSVVGIIAGLAFVQTNHQNSQRDWGYSSENKIILNIPDREKYSVLENELRNLPMVESFSGSDNFIGNGLVDKEVTNMDDSFNSEYLKVQPRYLDQMEVELVSGRSLSDLAPAEYETSVLVNETFLKRMGISEPLEKEFKMDSSSYVIAGVVKDFRTEYFHAEARPLIIEAGADEQFNYLTLNYTEGADKETMEQAQASWRRVFPRALFGGQFQDQVFENAKNDAQGVQNILLVASGICILLAAMGLFGLISLNLKARIKDYCVRKVYGAETSGLAFSLIRKYLILATVSAAIGSGLAWFAVGGFLDSFFAYHSGVGVIPIGSSLLLLISVIIITGASQIWRLDRANPSIVLKSE